MSDTLIIENVVGEARKRLRLSCDEYHAHAFTSRCFSGDDRDLAVVMLHDQLAELRGRISDFIEKNGK